jgi:hypothetical protein
MPFGDGTGPVGQGPKTGRGAGYCAGNGMPGYANPVPRRGFRGRGGRGRGFAGRGGRRGWRLWYYATGEPGWARAPYGFAPWRGPAVYPPHEATHSGPDKEEAADE